jgi:hypothetical protein
VFEALVTSPTDFLLRKAFKNGSNLIFSYLCFSLYYCSILLLSSITRVFIKDRVSFTSIGILLPMLRTGPALIRRSLLPIEIEFELNRPFLTLSISASDCFYINLLMVSASGEVTEASNYFLNSSFV